MVTKEEGYTILREKFNNEIQTYVVVPIKEFISNTERPTLNNNKKYGKEKSSKTKTHEP